MNPQKRRKPAGWTLTELMITVAIVGILSTVAAPMLTQLTNFWLMTRARAEIQRDARISLDTMNRFIRQAQSSTIVIDTPSSGGPYSRISFTAESGKTMKFYQKGNQLFMTSGSATTVLSKNLGYIAFTFPQSNDPTILSIALTMSKAIQEGKSKVLELTIEDVRVMN